MQIFVFYKDLKKSAEYLYKKNFLRFNKQILELGQIISTTVRMKYNLFDNKIGDDEIYKVAYANHPIVVWTRENDDNFIWSLCYLKVLLDVFKKYRKKEHSTEKIYRNIAKVIKIEKIPNVKNLNLTNHRNLKNIYLAYRMYLQDKLTGKYKNK